jgi:hypothetical protein
MSSELCEVYSMPDFALVERRLGDEEEGEGELEEELESDGESEAEEGNAGVAVGDPAGAVGGRCGRKRKRARPKDKEAVAEKTAAKRRAVDRGWVGAHAPADAVLIRHSASSLSLLLQRAPKEKLHGRTLLACEGVACSMLHGGGGDVGWRVSASLRGMTPPSREELLASGYRLVKAGSQ